MRKGSNDRVTDTDPSASVMQLDPMCLAIVEARESGPDLCTIYSTASEDSLVTTWISAHEGSYCALEDYR
ncbi:DUF7511 domain-containing protein [Halorubrum vacuolatum]|uniref:DUF7511 domain-containing protein n=1 Tax=Halorubrum vacuolatum TaxID=63740 RepID=A0A238Y212_HALVU|nr:hypothetical protein SAMN06264855_1287 [Halorubrum vacuolatum]